jgi:Mrp family chromosome partitioning ATPase/capsular polysaccharide biosynthesis protein
MELTHFLRLLRRSWRLLVLSTCVGALVGVGIAVFRPKGAAPRHPLTYWSATETLGYDPTAAGQTVSDGMSDLATVASFATGQAVTDGVGQQLGTDGATDAEHITTVTRPTTNSIDITAYADSAASAQELASTFATVTISAYTRKVAAQAVEQATQLTKRLADLKARRVDVAQQLLNPALSEVDRDTLTAQSDALVDEYRVAYDRYISLPSADVAAPPLFTLAKARPGTIDAATYEAALQRGRAGQNHLDAATAAEVAQPATSGSTLPDGPVALGLAGALLGLMAGIGLMLLRAGLDSKLRTRADFEHAFGVPVLGSVPTLRSTDVDEEALLVTRAPFSPHAEVFRAVRAALLLLASDEPDREGALVVMMSSALPKEGKSTNCANLAAAFAESGLQVLAVNCDYRRPTLHRYFGVEDRPGVVQATSVPGVRVMSNVMRRRDNPGVVAATQRELVARSRAYFDVILLDTAPLMSTSDPIDIVSAADFVVMTGRPGRSGREEARQAMEILDRHRAVVAGLLLTGVDRGDKAASSYYYSYAVAPPAPPSRRASDRVAVETTTAPPASRRDRRRRRRHEPRPGQRGTPAPVSAGHAGAGRG